MSRKFERCINNANSVDGSKEVCTYRPPILILFDLNGTLFNIEWIQAGEDYPDCNELGSFLSLLC